MKRLISIIPILFWIACFNIALPNYAGMITVVNNSQLITSATPSYLFRWTCESTTADYVVTGADNTATASSAAAIDAVLYTEGTHSLDFPTADDLYTFTWANDTAKLDAGTLILKVYIDTFTNGRGIFRLYDDDNNRILITLSTDTNNHFVLYHIAGGTTRSIASTVAISNTTWYTVTAKWSTVAQGSNYLGIQIDSNAYNYGTTSLGTPNGDNSGTLVFGDFNGVGADHHEDDITIYGSWL
jgi:hypothetical protein